MKKMLLATPMLAAIIVIVSIFWYLLVAVIVSFTGWGLWIWDFSQWDAEARFIYLVVVVICTVLIAVLEDDEWDV